MSLTHVLREQHDHLSALLDEVGRLGLDCAEGHARLKDAQQAMLAHLALEDSQLYPSLRSNPATAKLAHRYADEMLQLTPALMAFFDSYQDGGIDPGSFKRSLEQLQAVLQQRISREEGKLYPAYEAHCSQG